MENWENALRILQSLYLDDADLYQLKLLPHTTLARMGAISIADALKDIPGVEVTDVSMGIF